MNERQRLWRRVILTKYGAASHIVEGYGKVFGYVRRNFGKGYAFRLDEKTVKFWTDKWCGEVTLRDRFPQLHCLSVSRDASVADYLVLGEGGLF